MMDILTLLKKDHKKVGALLKKADKTKPQAIKRREELFKQIKEELKVHTKVEEIIFYPPLKEYKATHDLIFEAYEEHGLVDVVIAQMEKVAYDSDQWTAKMTVLKELVEHHVDDEEDELFPKVRKVLKKAVLENMGKEMKRLKQELKLKQHFE